MRRIALVALVLAFAVAPEAGASSRTGVVEGIVTPRWSRLHEIAAASVHSSLARHDRLRPRRRAVARTTAGLDGAYRIRLAVGRYSLRLSGDARPLPAQVVVRSGHVTRIDIVVETTMS